MCICQCICTLPSNPVRYAKHIMATNHVEVEPIEPVDLLSGLHLDVEWSRVSWHPPHLAFVWSFPYKGRDSVIVCSISGCARQPLCHFLSQAFVCRWFGDTLCSAHVLASVGQHIRSHLCKQTPAIRTLGTDVHLQMHCGPSLQEL